MPDYPVLKVQFVNAKKTALAFGGLATKIRDWSKYIWPEIVKSAIRPHLQDMKRTLGAAGEHGSWAPLSPRYKAWKDQHYPGKPILTRTGEMWRQTLRESNRGELRPLSMTFSAPKPAGFHQTGFRTRFGKGTKHVTSGLRFVPARRLIDPTDAFNKLLTRAVAKGVANHARAFGFAVGGADLSPQEATELGKARLSA